MAAISIWSFEKWACHKMCSWRFTWNWREVGCLIWNIWMLKIVAVSNGVFKVLPVWFSYALNTSISMTSLCMTFTISIRCFVYNSYHGDKYIKWLQLNAILRMLCPHIDCIRTKKMWRFCRENFRMSCLYMILSR